MSKRLITFLLLAAALVTVLGTASLAASPVEITYMTFTINEIPFEQDLINQFEKEHPNIKVKVVMKPVDSFDSQIVLASKAGKAPDVFETRPGYTVSLGTMGVLQDLTSFVKEDPVYKQHFSRGAWDMGTWRGKQYAVPWRDGTWAIYANPKLFEDAGVELPSKWTFEEFLKAAKSLTNQQKGISGFAFSGSRTDLGTSQSWTAFLFGMGGTLIENGKAVFNDKKGVEALQLYVDLVHKYKVTPSNPTALSYKDVTDGFGNGKVAMWANGPWYIATLRKAYPGIELKILPLPAGDNPGSATSGTLLAMSPQTKHPKEAWELVKFLTSEESLARWAEKGLFLPPLANPKSKFLTEPPMSVFVAMSRLPNTQQVGNLPEANTLWDILNVAIQKALLRSATSQEALNEAAEKWNQVLEKY